jgi:hypothetical protein
MRITALISTDFGRKNNENRAETFATAFHNMLDRHVNKTVFTGGIFGEFRLNGTEVIRNQLNNLIKAGHSVPLLLV